MAAKELRFANEAPQRMAAGLVGDNADQAIANGRCVLPAEYPCGSTRPTNHFFPLKCDAPV